MEKSGLYIVATPIGNLEDITFRAVRILRESSVIFCEDTRQTRKLLNHYEITASCTSFHSHSADSVIEHAIQLISEGKLISYVTDCGTPGVSDPGSRLVSSIREKGFPVFPIPGPSALAAIVSVSGFKGKRIAFGGFTSKKGERRRKEIASFSNFDGIIVFYESPHRIRETLSVIGQIYPTQQVLVGRELTKLFEECILFAPGTLSQKADSVKEKGEFVIAIDNSGCENQSE